MNGNIIFEKLLCYGLFPERLDGIFTSKEFGLWVLNNISRININKKCCFSTISYKITRNNNASRLMGIPHPLAYINLCQEVYKSWKKINSVVLKCPDYEKKSMIRPKIDNKNNMLVSLTSYDQDLCKEQLMLDKKFGKKYFVHVDIANFFPSIYTHSIPWALVGKTAAKRNKKDRIWFNRIDKVTFPPKLYQAKVEAFALCHLLSKFRRW